jgi:hypothetical protein
MTYAKHGSSRGNVIKGPGLYKYIIGIPSYTRLTLSHSGYTGGGRVARPQHFDLQLLWRVARASKAIAAPVPGPPAAAVVAAQWARITKVVLTA